MASIASYLVNPFIRLSVKAQLASDPTGRSDEEVARRVRRAFATPVFPPPGGRYTRTTMGVPGLHTAPRGAIRGTVLYLHGGGYIACSAASHKPFTYAFARRGYGCFAPDYRLAPEHRYPAAVEDALAAYRAMLDAGTEPGRLAVAGDSAGGGLTLSLLLEIRRLGLPMPACAVLFSPVTDLAFTGESLRSNAKSDPMLSARSIPAIARVYLGQGDPRDPVASPLYADLAGLPPLALHASRIEILRDDSTRLAERARAAGVSAEITLWDNMPHVWPMFQLLLPEARRTMDEVATFCGRHMRG